MRNALLLVSLSLALTPLTTAAETIAEALEAAYWYNTGIRAAEAQAKATSEVISQAKASRLPKLTTNIKSGMYSSYSKNYNPFGNPTFSTSKYNLYNWNITLTQILYGGGAVVAGIEKARADAKSQYASLAMTEQSVLLNAATAYVDMSMARENMAATQQIKQDMLAQKSVVESALARHDATIVDLDQIISRIEDMQAQNLQFEGALEIARANYMRWIGHDPDDHLEPPQPISDLPASREEIMHLGISENPSVYQANFAEQSAQADIDVAISTILPKVALYANCNDEVDWTRSYQGETRNCSALLEVSIPIFQGGAPAAKIGIAKEVQRQRRTQILLTKNQASQAAVAAWSSKISAQSVQRSSIVQRNSAEIALAGLLREQQKGLRTVLYTLNGRTELLKAQLAEIKARRDLILSEYQILAAIGSLSHTMPRWPVTSSGTSSIPDQSVKYQWESDSLPLLQ